MLQNLIFIFVLKKNRTNFITQISYTCMWQHYSRSSRPKQQKLARFEATMYIKYRHRLLAMPMFMKAFFTALLARAFPYIGRLVDNNHFGSGRPSFSLK